MSRTTAYELLENLKRESCGCDLMYGYACGIHKTLELLRREIYRLEMKSGACPCTIIEPCSDVCSCAYASHSGGCYRCAAWGSLEQRTERARQLAGMSR